MAIIFDFSEKLQSHKLSEKFIGKYLAQRGFVGFAVLEQGGYVVTPMKCLERRVTKLEDPVFKLMYNQKSGMFFLYNLWEDFRWKVFDASKELEDLLDVIVMYTKDM